MFQESYHQAQTSRILDHMYHYAWLLLYISNKSSLTHSKL
uniref:Uncharacterized protein n=1 Tax=Podoviridae sp. ctG4L18 TaxID=2825234 RepID=A0A8S5UNU7_9CAUD|nr:MAG TPA: hypothetical protein [Podoviridae sp. ctG4L18]